MIGGIIAVLLGGLLTGGPLYYALRQKERAHRAEATLTTERHTTKVGDLEADIMGYEDEVAALKKVVDHGRPDEITELYYAKAMDALAQADVVSFRLLRDAERLARRVRGKDRVPDEGGEGPEPAVETPADGSGVPLATELP